MTPSTRLASRLALGLLIAGIAGCNPIDARLVRLGPPLAPLARRAPVAVYHPPLPSLHAREVAFIEVTAWSDESLAELLPRVRELARSVGANAIVWLRTDRVPGFLRVVASALRVGP